MISIEERIKNEQLGNEEGVRLNNGCLRKRFSLVWQCPHSLRAEQTVRDIAAKAMPGRDVLEIGLGSVSTTSRHYAQLNSRRLYQIDNEEQVLIDALRFAPSAKFFSMDAKHRSIEESSFNMICGRAILPHHDFEAGVLEI